MFSAFDKHAVAEMRQTISEQKAEILWLANRVSLLEAYARAVEAFLPKIQKTAEIIDAATTVVLNRREKDD